MSLILFISDTDPNQEAQPVEIVTLTKGYKRKNKYAPLIGRMKYKQLRYGSQHVTI